MSYNDLAKNGPANQCIIIIVQEVEKGLRYCNDAEKKQIRIINGGKMKKSWIITVIALFVIAIVGVLLFAYLDQRYTGDIRSNWGIELPAPSKQIYYTDDGPSWMGDGTRYHLFQYHDDKKISKAFEWKDISNLPMESEIVKLIESIDVPDEYAPDFKKKYKYFIKKSSEDSSTIYLIFFEDTNQLYIIENIF
ncbi:MAG: hypothetical protein WBL80_08270 [Erysipelotrichaceae bacterium]